MNDTLILPCSSCGTLNRVPRSRLTDVPVCSDCRERLLDPHPKALTAATFDRFTTASDLPVVVDFWAPWCAPCLAMAPQLERASAQLVGRALCAKLDTQQNPDVAAQFTIQGIPTLVLFDHGKEVARTSGAMPSDQIVSWIVDHLPAIRT